MPGFDAPPPDSRHHDDDRTAARNARLGLILFTIYCVLYGGFVLISAFAPTVMEATPLAGVNLAILYGLGLIASALILAFLYGWLCRFPATPGDPS